MTTGLAGVGSTKWIDIVYFLDVPFGKESFQTSDSGTRRMNCKLLIM
ncbi:hypothetical protein GCM10023158_17280 [Gluconacetobacter tumulicola]